MSTYRLAHAGYLLPLTVIRILPNGKNEKDGAVTLAAIVTEGLLSPKR
jgi:hypothetical protein